MRKLIASINMTLDGYCDHTAVSPDEETYGFFNGLMREADTLLYGRITYQLMEDYWPSVAKNPTGVKHEDEFAVMMDEVEKVVYSRTLREVPWRNSVLKREIVQEEVLDLKRKGGKGILAGSPSVILALTRFGLVDEYRLLVHPVVLGGGLPLFKGIQERVDLKLLKTRAFGCGAVALYYEPVKKG